jgi:hypothetical protein
MLPKVYFYYMKGSRANGLLTHYAAFNTGHKSCFQMIFSRPKKRDVDEVNALNSHNINMHTLKRQKLFCYSYIDTSALI